MDLINTTLITATNLPYYPLLKTTTLQLAELSPHVIPNDLWSHFDRIWTIFVGHPTKDFRFIQGVTPMSTFKETAICISLYYGVIFGGRELMRSKAPLKLNRLFMCHNFCLTAVSGALLLLFGQNLLPGLWKNGLYDGICGQTGWSQNLLVLYYLNYLTKYLELLDTVFLVVRKKPLTFLHTYHHGATALLCYTQLVGQTSVSWVPITLNLAVHVVMYWYYFQTARGVRVWWKQYITMFQITQFILDLGVIYWACWNYFASEYAPYLPHYGTCGERKQEVAALTGCAILSSYLVLFIMFYLTTYKKKPVAKTAPAFRKVSKVETPTVQEATGTAMDALKLTSKAIAMAPQASALTKVAAIHRVSQK